MTTFLNTFRKVGGEFAVDDDGIRFFHPGGDLRSITLETDVHPGFMTDWQQPLVVALTQAKGLSIVHETVYENRFGFTDALRRHGRDHPGLQGVPGRAAVPVRAAQLLPLGRDLRPDAARAPPTSRCRTCAAGSATSSPR